MERLNNELQIQRARYDQLAAETAALPDAQNYGAMQQELEVLKALVYLATFRYFVILLFVIYYFIVLVLVGFSLKFFPFVFSCFGFAFKFIIFLIYMDMGHQKVQERL